MPVRMLSATQHASMADTAASAAEPPAASVRRPTSAVAGCPAATPAVTPCHLPSPEILMPGSVDRRLPDRGAPAVIRRPASRAGSAAHDQRYVDRDRHCRETCCDCCFRRPAGVMAAGLAGRLSAVPALSKTTPTRREGAHVRPYPLAAGSAGRKLSDHPLPI